jgi:hypothetical protein
LTQQSFTFPVDPANGGHSFVAPRPQAGRAATKHTPTQKRFNKLVNEVETWRTRTKQRREELEAHIGHFQRVMLPQLRAVEAERRTLVLELARFRTKGAKLGVHQRKALDVLLLGQLARLLRVAPELANAPLAKLAEELNEAARARDEESGWRADPLGPAQAGGGDDDTAKGKDEPLTDEEREANAEWDRLTSGRADDPVDRGEMSAEQQLRAKNISTLYKRLARVFHPDLETDPARKAEKLVLMQRLTEAKERGDVHTLLSLEIEYIQGASEALAELDDKRLKLFCDELERQRHDLENDFHDVAHEPRFVVMQEYLQVMGDPEGMRTFRHELRIEWESMRSTLRGLRSPDGAKVVKAVLPKKRRMSLFDLLDQFAAL